LAYIWCYLKSQCYCLNYVHNHTSGKPIASEADHSITQKVKTADKLLNIAVLDHQIVIPDNYYSFADDGDL
jgi:DNA repair protein RadC